MPIRAHILLSIIEAIIPNRNVAVVHVDRRSAGAAIVEHTAADRTDTVAVVVGVVHVGVVCIVVVVVVVRQNIPVAGQSGRRHLRNRR